MHLRPLTALAFELFSCFGFISACSTDSDEMVLATSAQAVRAAKSEDGSVYLGIDLLVTDETDRGVPCSAGNVNVIFETSRNGLAGPWVYSESKDLHIRCNDKRGDLAMVVDNSGSLESDLELLKTGVFAVRDQLVSSGGRMSLVRVSTQSRVLVPLSKDKDLLGVGIESLKITNGWTALWDGIRMGNETLSSSDSKGNGGHSPNVASFCAAADKRAIVVFTDGGENNSLGQKITSFKYPGDGIDTTLKDLRQLRIDGITTPIYVVGLGNQVDEVLLRELAEGSGGKYIGIKTASEIPSVLSMIEEYFANTRRVCATAPFHQCGMLDVRVTYRYKNKGTDVTKQRLERMYVPCEARVLGRVATILLTLTGTTATLDVLSKLVANTVNFVSPTDSPRVLFVRDDFTHEENDEDTGKLKQILTDQGYAADYINEPADGISLESLSGYDVVWFSNPGYSIDDVASFNTLVQFSQNGGGVVLQGDDMSMSFGNAFPVSELTRLFPKDNGVTYCGKMTNNDKGSRYEVSLASTVHPLLHGISGSKFYYGNDIDTASLVDSNTEVLAWATVEGAKKDCVLKPVITVYSPKVE
jgi:Mg-chelatase subunit ChlD